MQHIHHHPAATGAEAAGFWGRLFDTGFVPRAQCFNMDPAVIWLHVVSDVVIAAAYYSIPVALVIFVLRRRDLVFHWMFLLFGAFILLCGTTHLFDILAVWMPVYRLDGVVKAFTGIVSIGTAAALWPLIPRALELPSPDSLRSANLALAKEIEERRAAQAELQRARDELEARVQERTSELAAANLSLQTEIGSRKQAQEELALYSGRLEELVAERTRELGFSHERLRLSERMAALGTLAAGLGHDMGNLLLPVRTHLESIQAASESIGGAALPESAREDLTVIRKCVEHLQRLAVGLRLFARDPAEGVDVGEATHLQQWWTDVEPFFKNLLPRRIGLTFELEPGAGAAAVAPHRLTQAVFNLVQNAGEAIASMEAGGEPAPPGARQVRIWARPGPDSTVQIGVSDNGPGMTPEVRRRCLEPFFSTKTRGISTGLGLALVHGIVQTANGSIRIESSPGRGATFVLTLPAADTRPAAAARRAVVSLADPRASSFVRDILRAFGYDAEVSEGGGAGAGGDPWGGRDPAVWVTDAAADGATLAAARRLRERSRGTRIVVVGGERGDAWDALAAAPREGDGNGDGGVFRVETETFSPARLRDGLRAALT